MVGLFEPPNPADAQSLVRGLTDFCDLGGAKKRGLRVGVLKSLTKSLCEFRPDLVQANAFNALRFTSIARLLGRASWPLIYRNVGLASQWISYPGQRLWGRMLLRQVSRVHSVSGASRKDFAETYGFPTDRIDVLRQGVVIPGDFPKELWRKRLLARMRKQSCEHLVVHIGCFSPEKNHQGLLDAFCELRRRLPECHLALFGDGPLRDFISNMVSQLGLRENVHLLGACSNAADLAGGADVMLVSSHIEGIPGVLLEACARRLPTVSTDVGGIAEIIAPGRSGVLVPANAMTCLGQETAKLLIDPRLRSSLGNEALNTVASSYNMESSIDELEAKYRSQIVPIPPDSAAH